MEITMRAKAVFEFKLTQDQLDVLMTVAEHHYDYRCKCLARVGGLIYGWVNHFNFAQDQGDEDYTMSATFKDLDILSKCLENMGCLSREEQQVARGLAQRFHAALMKANEEMPKLSWAV